jgi:pimeloyl-ACP methyl ester carboxylesterase
MVAEHEGSAGVDMRIDEASGTKRSRVVLVHCSASSARQWNALVNRFGNDLAPIAVNLLAHGGRGAWRGDGPLTLAEEARAIAEATAGDDAPFHLVGHSYGGGVALRFALEHQARLCSLTLIEPSCFHLLKEADDEPHLLDEIRGLIDAFARGVVSGDYRAGMAMFIDYWSGPGSWAALSEEKREQFAGLAVHIAPNFRALIEERTPLAAYRAIEVPTLVLCGDRSPRPSRALTRLVAAALPHARHRTIGGGNHMAPILRPDDVNPLILEHIEANATCVEPRTGTDG